MSDSDIDVSVDLSGYDLTTLADRLRKRLAEGFEKELTEWGEQDVLPSLLKEWPRPSWPALAPSTVAEKKRLGYPATPLVRTGALQAAATQRGAPGNVFQVEPYALTLGVDTSVLPYAAVQQFGSGRVPARPYLLIQQEQLARLQAKVEKSLQDAIEGG